MSGWFSDVVKAAQQIKEQARRLSQDATPFIDSAVSAVREHAVKMKEEAATAAEALRYAAREASNEIMQEQEKLKWAADPHSGADHIVRLLPWEAEDESESIFSQRLMEQILSLSLDEANFRTLTEKERAQFSFRLENYVEVVLRVLELDSNLRKVHRKLGCRMTEKELWHAYFYRCACLRAHMNMNTTMSDYAIVGPPLWHPSGGDEVVAPLREHGNAHVSDEAAITSQRAGSPSRDPSVESLTNNVMDKGPTNEASSVKVIKQIHNSDDIDLDGLELKIDEGGEAIEDGALAELEAQIAKELDQT